MLIHLVRHAEAEELRPGSKDAERRLTSRGEGQARRLRFILERLNVRYGAVISSPKVRAVQTAQAIEGLGDGFETTTLLAAGPGDALLEMIRARSGPLALVGHEPYLSQLVSLLLLGTTNHAGRFEFKKAAVYALEWPDEPRLVLSLPQSAQKRLTD